MAATSTFRQIRRLWNFMQGNRLLYIGAIVAIGLATAFSLVGPLILRTTIDSIIGDAPIMQAINAMIQSIGGKGLLVRNLWLCSLALIFLALAEGVFLYLKGKWSATAAESTAQYMRDRLYDHLQHLSYAYHVRTETGDLVQRCTSDVETIRRFLALQFVEIGRAVFIVMTVVPLMFILDRKMALVATSLIPLIFGFAVFF